MASIFKKGKYIYISWWDHLLNKTVNRSTKMPYTKENMRQARIMADKIQKKLDADKIKLENLGLKKETIAYAMEHFLKNNSFKKKQTLYEYQNFFKDFNNDFPPSALCAVINKSSVEDWMVKIKGRNVQINTKYSKYKILKKFLSFLFEYNYIQVFVINKDLRVTPEVKEITVFSDSDLEILIKNLNLKNNNFKTTVLLLLYTGLRPSDIYNIKCEDVDLDKKVLKYYSEKTKDYFMVPIHENLVPILRDRINEIKTGLLLDYETINNIGKAVRRYFKKIGLNGKGYNLRTFRKTFISLANANGIELALVSKLVGHRSITTTAKYYNKIELSRQEEELNKIKFSPVVNKQDIVNVDPESDKNKSNKTTYEVKDE